MPDQKKTKAELGSPPSYSSANRKSDLQHTPLWSALPPNALREIYLCSAFKDRVSMGAVCRSWREGYRDPALWRSRNVQFGKYASGRKLNYEFIAKSKGGVTFTSGKNAKRFEDLFSTYLENLDIFFVDDYSGLSKETLTDFLEFYSSLGKSHLRSLTLHHLDLQKLNHPMRLRFLKSFMKLTSRQKFLKKFHLKFQYFGQENCLQFLKCLAGACGDTLENLYIKGLLEDLSIYQQQQVVTELEKFKSLSRIHVDYNIVSEEVIKRVALGCPNLSFIKFWVNSYILPCNVISCRAWQELVDTHPNLLVDIHAQMIESTRQMMPILAPAMPLHKLKWVAWDEGTEVTLDVDLKCLLHRVASYHRTIKVLFIDVAGEFPTLHNVSVQNILANCRNLLPFTCAQIGDPRTEDAFWTLDKIDWFT